MNKAQFWGNDKWSEDASEWINQQLTKLNVEPVSDCEKVSGWALGQILKQPTNNGDYYFKATAFLPLFSNEAKLCSKLTELFSDVVPAVVATDNNRQLMLTKSFGNAFDEDESHSTWADAFSVFAELQINSIKNVESLKANGCLHRPIEKLSDQLAEIFSDNAVMVMLPTNIIADVKSIITAVKKAAEELKAFEIPESLVHGDLHIENIAPTNESFTFFDWSDACISHPFIDGTYIYRLPDGEAKAHIVKSYLESWSEFAPIQQLESAWQIAEVVCYAHQAVSYASMLVHITEEEKADLQTAFDNAFKRLHSKSVSS